MKFNFLEWAQKNGVTFDPKDPAGILANTTKYVEHIAETLPNAITDAQKEAYAKAMAPITEQVAQLLDAQKAQGLELQKMRDAGGIADKAVETMWTGENIKGIRDVMAGQRQSIDITKAVTTRASVVNNGLALDLPEVGQLASRRNTFYEFLVANGRIRTVPQNANGTVRYIDWDEATKVRAAAPRAEGVAFPESTAAWQTYTVQLKKIGDMLPWTDEFQYDDAFLVRELEQFLLVNIALIKNYQLILGDNTGQNLAGMINVCPTYTPVAAAIDDASIYDLVVKLRETIEAEAGSKYRTNFALMNIVDINKYKLKKTTEGNYVMPPFYDREGNRIDGVTVIEDNAVVANTMYIGDVNYTHVFMQPGAVVETGYINDDFSKGQKRMRVYERVLFLIRTVDRTGFLKVTDIDAALVTLAS